MSNLVEQPADPGVDLIGGEVVVKPIDPIIPDPPKPLGLQVSLVPTMEIERIWHLVAPHLTRAIEMSRGRYTMKDLKAKLCSGEFHLWVIFDEHIRIIAAVTSTFTLYPTGKKVLHGQFLGGSRLDDWQDKFCEIFDNWGRDNKCVSVEFSGRGGWKKVLARNGYMEIWRTYEKDLK